MADTHNKNNEEQIYLTYLKLRRKDEEHHLQTRLMQRKFKNIPARSSRKAKAFLNSPEYLQEKERFFADQKMLYLTLPLNQQLSAVRQDYENLREFISEDLRKKKKIRSYPHYQFRLHQAMNDVFLETANRLVEEAEVSGEAEKILEELIAAAENGFSRKELYVFREMNGWPSAPLMTEQLSTDNLTSLEEPMNILFNIIHFVHRETYTYLDVPYAGFITDRIISYHREILQNVSKNHSILFDTVLDSSLPGKIIDQLNNLFSPAKVHELLSANENYLTVRQAYQKMEERETHLRSVILKTIPDRYRDMFPLARSIRRKFIIHSGPTNSGKTYAAVRRMIQTGNGVYLGPLRLMAYEQYETIRELSGKCTMVTGEEEIREEGSCFTASTIEMMRTSAHYECAVIDEAQMIGDLSRGGSWSAAMYGIYADEIHVCTAPEALDLLIRIIQDCEDEYTVIHHERFTPLIAEKSLFDASLKNVRKGDALIVFSRRSVHAVAADLQKRGRSVSIIYGALPYDVRHEEARKFSAGETEVLVATDAIGMGMNLPIKRVVFLEQYKFDGYEHRFLNTSEILQIAGRAGRKGMYDIGYAATAGSRRLFLNQFQATPKKTEKACISFPDILLTLDCSLSETLERWKNIEVLEDHLKADVDDQITLAKAAEAHIDDKELIYRLVSIPFDINTSELWDTWMDLVIKEAAGIHCDLSGYLENAGYTIETGDISDLETEYRRMDLLYAYCRQVTGDTHSCAEISAVRRKLSEKIMKILSEQKLTPKKCTQCGRELAWNYPFRLCRSCWNRRSAGSS